MFEPSALSPKPNTAKPRFDHKVIRPNGPWVPAQLTDVAKTWARFRDNCNVGSTPARGASPQVDKP